MKSCIYTGRVSHARLVPIRHLFSYRLYMMYLDLDEIEKVFRNRWFWSSTHRAVARFRRDDHLGDPGVPLDTAVRSLVHEHTGIELKGPIRLLTHLRYFGHCFNPVSFYFCFDREDRYAEVIVAEVNNTPWGQRHCYVLESGVTAPDRSFESRFTKSFHVSPFMPMEMDYKWKFSHPDEQLKIEMRSFQNDQHVFGARLEMERRQITTASLAGVLLRFPFMTLKVIAAIYLQALRLWMKKTPFYTHPMHDHDPRSAQP